MIKNRYLVDFREQIKLGHLHWKNNLEWHTHEFIHKNCHYGLRKVNKSFFSIIQLGQFASNMTKENCNFGLLRTTSQFYLKNGLNWAYFVHDIWAWFVWSCRFIIFYQVDNEINLFTFLYWSFIMIIILWFTLIISNNIIRMTSIKLLSGIESLSVGKRQNSV